MIIECESCQSKYNLDEGLLKSGGSKVRCSVCKNVFTAYPPEEVRIEEPATDMILEEGLAETLSLDSRTEPEEEEAAQPMGANESEFDLAFEEAMEEADVHKGPPSDELPSFGEEEVVTPVTEDMPREEAEEGYPLSAGRQQQPRPGRISGVRPRGNGRSPIPGDGGPGSPGSTSTDIRRICRHRSSSGSCLLIHPRGILGATPRCQPLSL